MNLKNLRYFATLAEELHFGRAAARHNITQSPLSVGIRQLEDELGFRLFERDSKHVALTATGQAFLRVAQELLNHSERAVQFGNALAKGRLTEAQEAAHLKAMRHLPAALSAVLVLGIERAKLRESCLVPA